MLRFKEGVRIDNLCPQMVLAAVTVFSAFNGKTTITSGNDGKHKVGSLHYQGRALDFRTKDQEREGLEDRVTGIALALGDNYDVLLEGLGQPWEHLHVEYDP